MVVVVRVEASDDYKNRGEDSFSLITPEQAVAALCAIAFIVSVFRDFL